MHWATSHLCYLPTAQPHVWHSPCAICGMNLLNLVFQFMRHRVYAAILSKCTNSLSLHTVVVWSDHNHRCFLTCQHRLEPVDSGATEWSIMSPVVAHAPKDLHAGFVYLGFHSLWKCWKYQSIWEHLRIDNRNTCNQEDDATNNRSDKGFVSFLNMSIFAHFSNTGFNYESTMKFFIQCFRLNIYCFVFTVFIMYTTNCV